MLLFLHLFSVLFRCVKFAVASCFYIYLEWLNAFFDGLFVSCTRFSFLSRFVLPFLPLNFAEVDAR